MPTESREGWEFVRDPLPARTEDGAFDRIRRNIGANDTQWQFRPEELSKLSTAIRRTQLENNLLPNYGDRFKTLLLRRLGSSMEAGRRTVIKLLGHEFDEFGDEDDDFDDDDFDDDDFADDDFDDDDFDDDANQDLSPANTNPNRALSEFKNFTQAVEDTDWETCSLVLDPISVREILSQGW